MKKQLLLKLTGDFRFWIFIFFALRLYGITHPPLEVAHNWRQTTVTMVARNFYEEDSSILFPRIDIAGEKSGITGMEFPVYNYLIYLLSLVFGYAHWYGRIINLVSASLGIWFFGRIAGRYFGKENACFSVLILLSSIWFMYGRKIMPDTFSASLMIAGLWYGLRYLVDKSGTASLLLFVVLSSAGMLSKLPSAVLAGVFLIPVFSGNINRVRKVVFITAAFVAIIPVAWWYACWCPHLVKEYGFQHFFMGTGILQGIQELWAKPGETLANFYENALKYSGFMIFVFGVYRAFRNRQKLLIRVLIISFLLFLIFMIVAGDNFPRHSYYIIPFVPVMALVAGYGVSEISLKWLRLTIVGIICLEGIANQIHDFRIKPEQAALLTLEHTFDSFSKRDDLVLINSGLYPTPMYFAHRKGWVATNADIAAPGFITKKGDQGLRYVVILKKLYEKDMVLNLPLVSENQDFRIYRIGKK